MGRSNDKGPAEVGKAAPDLSVKTVNGKGEITRDSLAGKVAIVDFWATWCGPCKQSFPKLEELAKQNQGKVQVVGISVDDKSDGVADFAKSNGATFPIGWDDGHAIANRWKVDSMPTTYILDSSGTVRYIHAGYHDGEAETIAQGARDPRRGARLGQGEDRGRGHGHASAARGRCGRRQDRRQERRRQDRRGDRRRRRRQDGGDASEEEAGQGRQAEAGWRQEARRQARGQEEARDAVAASPRALRTSESRRK